MIHGLWPDQDHIGYPSFFCDTLRGLRGSCSTSHSSISEGVSFPLRYFSRGEKLPFSESLLVERPESRILDVFNPILGVFNVRFVRDFHSTTPSSRCEKRRIYNQLASKTRTSPSTTSCFVFHSSTLPGTVGTRPTSSNHCTASSAIPRSRARTILRQRAKEKDPTEEDLPGRAPPIERAIKPFHTSGSKQLRTV